MPIVAWLGLVLSLSLHYYGLCKPDLLAHWEGEFVGVKGEDCHCGLDRHGERWVLLGENLGGTPDVTDGF